MLRFFVRSALGLANMYRWNELIYASAKVLAVDENHPDYKILEDNCRLKIDCYYFRWKSAKPLLKVIWNSLKLMYFWFFLIVAALLIWGIVVLDKNCLYWLGILVLLFSTVLETYWLVTWVGLKYEKLALAKEPDFLEITNINANVK
jgi:hypothetical protein